MDYKQLRQYVNGNLTIWIFLPRRRQSNINETSIRRPGGCRGWRVGDRCSNCIHEGHPPRGKSLVETKSLRDSLLCRLARLKCPAQTMEDAFKNVEKRFIDGVCPGPCVMVGMSTAVLRSNTSCWRQSIVDSVCKWPLLQMWVRTQYSRRKERCFLGKRHETTFQ